MTRGFGDLAILRARRVSRLNLARTPVTDLTPLAGMPLTELYIDDAEVTDVRPLLRCPRRSRPSCFRRR